jgi:hypothetical protein
MGRMFLCGIFEDLEEKEVDEMKNIPPTSHLK